METAEEISKELDVGCCEVLSEAVSSCFQDSPSSHWVDHSLEMVFFAPFLVSRSILAGQILLIALNFYLHFPCASVLTLALTLLQKRRNIFQIFLQPSTIISSLTIFKRRVEWLRIRILQKDAFSEANVIGLAGACCAKNKL